MPENLNCLYATISHMSKKHADEITLTKAHYDAYNSATVSSDDEMLCRMLIYVLLIDSYDAWLYLRSSANIPEVPEEMLRQISSRRLMITLPKGNSLQDKLKVAIRNVQVDYAPKPIDASKMMNYTHQLLRNVSGNFDIDMSSASEVNSAVNKVIELQRMCSYFNYLQPLKGDSAGRTVLFGTDPEQDFGIYSSVVRNPNYYRPRVTLSSFYKVPFVSKMNVVKKFSLSNMMDQPLTTYTTNIIQMDFYRGCLKYENEIVQELEKDASFIKCREATF